jgi:hypothetical protein
LLFSFRRRTRHSTSTESSVVIHPNPLRHIVSLRNRIHRCQLGCRHLRPILRNGKQIISLPELLSRTGHSNSKSKCAIPLNPQASTLHVQTTPSAAISA